MLDLMFLLFLMLLTGVCIENAARQRTTWLRFCWMTPVIIMFIVLGYNAYA